MESSGKITIIDSSVWVAYFLSIDSQHGKALLIGNDLASVKQIPDFILFETATVLKQKGGLREAELFLEVVLDSTIQITNTIGLMQDFSKVFLLPDCKKLSFADSALLALHKTGNYKVITFDKDLLKEIKKIK